MRKTKLQGAVLGATSKTPAQTPEVLIGSSIKYPIGQLADMNAIMDVLMPIITEGSSSNMDQALDGFGGNAKVTVNGGTYTITIPKFNGDDFNIVLQLGSNFVTTQGFGTSMQSMNNQIGSVASQLDTKITANTTKLNTIPTIPTTAGSYILVVGFDGKATWQEQAQA